MPQNFGAAQTPSSQAHIEVRRPHSARKQRNSRSDPKRSRWGPSADINGTAIGRRSFRLPRNVGITSAPLRQPFSRAIPLFRCRRFRTRQSNPRSNQLPRSAAAPIDCPLQQHTMASIARSSLLRQVASARPSFQKSVIANAARAPAFHTTARRELLPPLPRAYYYSESPWQ